MISNSWFRVVLELYQSAELALSKTKTAATTGRDTISRATTMFGLVMPGSRMLPYFITAAPPRDPKIAGVTLSINTRQGRKKHTQQSRSYLLPVKNTYINSCLDPNTKIVSLPSVADMIF